MKLSKKNYLFGVLFSILFLYLTSCSDSNPVDPVEYGKGDDYLVYSEVIKDAISESNLLIVLSDSTVHDTFIGNDIDYFLENIPEVSRETLENFVAKNKTKMSIKRISGIDFIYQSEFDDSVEKKVSVTLSKVGYNYDNTEAVVTIGLLYSPLAGSGSLIYLKKVNGKWKVINGVMTWIS